MKKLSLIFALSLLALSSAFAQIGINTVSPDEKAVLDIQINPLLQGGLLIPRMNQEFRRNIVTVGGVTTIPNSLMIFDTDLNKFTYYDLPTSKWLYLNPFYAIANDPLNSIPPKPPISDRERTRVGFQTTSPITDLHIKGDTYFEGNTSTTGSATINNVIVPGFPNNALVPAGVIVMWYGLSTNVPTGWTICGGGSIGGFVIPDLRDRFIVGAGNGYSKGTTGGNDNITLLTAQLPSHTHDFSGTTSTNGDHNHSTLGYDDLGPAVAGSFQTGEDDGSPVWTSTSTNGNHSHSYSGTTTSAGSGNAIDIRPKYHALFYIIKLP